jgi:BNR repeat-containing family member
MRASRFGYGLCVALVGTAVGIAVVDRGVRAAETATRSVSDDFQRSDGALGGNWASLRGSWSVRSGAAVAGGAAERVAAWRGLALGATFDAAVTLTLHAPADAGRSWAGVATNVVDHGTGVQSFYALRVGQKALDGGDVLWQLVRVDHSAEVGAASASSLLAAGIAGAPPGTTLHLRMSSASGGGALLVQITGAAVPVSRTVGLRAYDRLVGGGVGLYSQGGTMGVLDFAAQTTTAAASVSFVDSFQRADGAVAGGWRVARGTWSIAGGVAVPSGTSERVMYPDGLTLGASFVLRASLTLPATAPSYRPWAGLAFNLTDNGDGTQTYYALRIGQAAENGSTALWQVVRMDHSAATLVRGGSLTAPPGTRLSLGVAGRNRGTGIEFGITANGVTPVDEYVGFPLGTALSGGRAGVYSNQGSVGLDDVGIDTTGTPPDVPTSFAALDCSPGAPDGYPLPGATQTVDPQVVEVGTTWAGHPVGQAILTAGADQYVGYYDADRVMTIAKRTLPGTTWTYQALPSVLGWDSHNYITMALDSTGNLHVAGNMHAAPMVYFRTTTPGDVTSLTRIPAMVDAALEDSVTYPRFFTDGSGALLFSYREGSSGSGDTYYDRFDPTTKTWSRLLSTPLTSGEGLRSGYEEGPTLGPDGYWHLAVVWRDTIDASTASMPSYLRSPDLVHWQDSAGNKVPLPLTYPTSDAIDPVPVDGGALNGDLKIGFDAAGRVLLTYAKYDTNLTNQIYAARPDGHGGWVTTQLTHWTGRWEIQGGGSLSGVQFQLMHGAVALPDGNLRIDYQCQGANRTLVVTPDTLQPVADVATPDLPPAITAVTSTFPGMHTRTAVSPVGDGAYVLRWESLSQNGDLPRAPADTPAPVPLRVYLVHRS